MTVVAWLLLGAAALAPAHLDDETYSETFTVAAELSSGVYLQIEYAISNIGPGDDHGACRLVLSRPGTKTLVRETIVDRPGWSHASDALTIGDCKLENGAEPRATASFPDIQVTLTLAAPLVRSTPPGGRALIDGDIFEAALLLPFGKAEARLGSETLVGTGHVDHFRVTALPRDLARYWVRLRALDAGVLLGGRVLPDGERAEGFLLLLGGSAEPLTSLAVRPTPSGGFVLEVRSASEQLTLVSTTPLQRYAPVEALGVFGKVVSALLGNPVTYRQRVEIRRGEERSSGVLELTSMDE